MSRQKWKEAAKLSGLQDVKVSWLVPGITARSGPVEVRIRRKGRSTRVVVTVPGPPGFDKMAIHSRPLVWEDIEIGDPYFDKRVIEGPVQLVSALLDEEMRRLLTHVGFQCDLQLSSGRLRADMVDEKILEVLPNLLEIARRITQPIDIPQRLAENAARDRKPGVRLHNLRLLIDELHQHPATAEAIRTACSDENPQIRLCAAMVLGDEARDVLVGLAEKLEVDAVSVDALKLLNPGLPFDRMKAVLEQAVDRRRLRTALFCLQAIGRGRTAEAVDILANVLAKETGDLAPAAAHALGETGNRAAEPHLIRAFERKDDDLRLAVAGALGRVGSVEAVLTLKEAAERPLFDSELRRTARQAIAEIQSRVDGASPGQLSLAGEEAGRLSLANDQAGQLSLDD